MTTAVSESTGGPPLIEVEGLVKRYGDVTAVDSLSFRVGEGEVVGFLGPNGAGKTTTMRMLTTYLVPTEGEIRIGGHDVLAEPEAVRRQIGYLPETPPLYEEMRVESYLHFAAAAKGVPRRDRVERVQAALAACHLTDRRRQVIGTLSKGYRQRVGLAQAIVHDPKVLILDEPTSGLDPTQIREVRKLITELAVGRTILLSTHILQEVTAVCNRVLIMHQGRLVYDAALTPEGGGISRHYHLHAEVDRSTLERLVGDAARIEPFAGAWSLELGAEVDPAEVLRRLVEGGVAVRAFEPAESNLERIFVEVTATDSVAAVEGGAA